ncbi:MAG: amidohydrolase family protein [Candidatus Heimdallarchaeota archaeon]|nr:MAG: amidohydrolase family protein [Candidatus Heimdallarchaeota archaeon]
MVSGQTKYKLLRTKYLLPLSDRLGRKTRIGDGFIFIKGEYIKEVGEYNEQRIDDLLNKYGSEIEIIGSHSHNIGTDKVPQINGVALPGFVKGHGHDHESPIIGIAKDVPLTTWLDSAVNLYTGFLHSEENSLTKHFGRSPYLITYLKARIDDLQHGITTALVHHCNFNKYHVDELIEANQMAGTKIMIAVGSQDRHYDSRILDKPATVAVERLDELYEKYKDTPNIKIIPGPDQFFSNGPELLKALKEWAREHNTLIHIHSSEEPATTKWFLEEYGMTPIEYGHSIDFLDEKTFVGHQVHCTENDLQILAQTKTKIVHNPLANTILGSGMPPLQEFKKRGIEFIISTDGSGSADNQNIINAARVATQFQKATHQDATLMTAQDVLERITTLPAQILGFNTGSIKPGKLADIIVVDLRVPNLTPTRVDNVVENLIWAANGNEIQYVIANGHLIINDYQFVKLNVQDILRQIQELSEIFLEYKSRTKAEKATGVREKA